MIKIMYRIEAIEKISKIALSLVCLEVGILSDVFALSVPEEKKVFLYEATSET